MKYHIGFLYFLTFINIVFILIVTRNAAISYTTAIQIIKDAQQCIQENTEVLQKAIDSDNVVIYEYNNNSQIPVIKNTKENFQK